MMNRILTVAAVLMCTATIASAQDQGKGGPPPRGDGQHRPGRPGMEMGKQLFEGVNLTEAQKGQIKAIHEKYQPQNEEKRKASMDAMKKAHESNDTAAMRAAMANRGPIVNPAMEKEIEAVLTPEQRDRYNKNKEEMKNKAKDRMKEGRGGMRMGGRGEGRGQGTPPGNAH